MPAPTTPFDISPTVASNGPDGATEQVSVLDDYARGTQACIRQLVNKGSDIASSATITPVASASFFDVTGTTGITTIASTNSWDGRVLTLQFDGALTLTHSATLVLPGAANYTTTAGDVLQFVQEASGTWRCIGSSRGVGTNAANITSGTLPVARLNGGTTGQFVRGDGSYSNTLLGPFTVTPTSGQFAINASGNVTINAPSSGAALTVNGLSGNVATFATTSGSANIISNSGVAGGAASLILQTASSVRLQISYDGAGPFSYFDYSDTLFFRRVTDSFATTLQLGGTGNVTVNAPTSGVAVAVTAVSAQYGITVSGGLGGQAVNWVATSDSRIKSEIADVSTTDAIRAVRMIHAKSYVKAGQRDLGLIAQDVQQLPGVFKDAVKQAEGDNMLALNYDGLTVAMLLPVVQHLLNEVDVLRARMQ